MSEHYLIDFNKASSPHFVFWDNDIADPWLIPHFKLKEFRSHGDDSKIIVLSFNLIKCLHELRSVFDESLFINSAFRTLERNKLVEGKPFSRHLIGEALDIRLSATHEKRERLIEQAKKIFPKVIRYDSHIHVEV